jgi:hypothetical protein
MAYGSLAIDTLNASTGVLATQNGMTGIAKAWVQYNGVTQTITSSFNVSSVTYNSTGNYTINFTTAMANANYVPTAIGYNDNSLYSLVVTLAESTPPTTSLFRVLTQQMNSTTVFNSARLYIAVLGN